MPSPLGHALGSLIVGAPARRGWLVLALVGMAPDLDLLWGRHSCETHSLGAALMAGALAMLVTRDRRTAILVALVWFAHPLMDALGQDSSPPRGVMLLWPFSREFFIAPVSVFDAVSRMYWRDDFVSHNLNAIAREVVLLGPIAAIAWLWRRRKT